VKAISHRISGHHEAALQVEATEGTATLTGGAATEHSYSLGLPPTMDAEIIVELGPDERNLQSFTASGLTLGGQAMWRYQYRFTGLVIP